ncbi:MAG: ATP-binding protein [Candidatus Limnocylindria bacterium]
MRACPSCGESNPDRFSDCAFCGTALAEEVQPLEERKVLTVIFCDLKDSTGLGERLDPEALGEVLDLYFTAMTRVIQRHGGTIQKFIGDAIVAAFGLPTIHEDDALRAIRAAAEMRAALVRLNVQLSAGYGVTLATRTGVHTGEVVVREAVNEQQVLTGDTLNTAARLEQSAGEGEILIGEPTFRLVRGAVETEPMPPLELKGKSEAVPAHRLIAVFGDEQSDRLHDAPLVGRENELQFLADLLERSIDERRCVLATVLGEAGVGKSRLVRELLDHAASRTTVLRGRCLPYGDGITFWPLLDIVRTAAGIGTDDPTDVAQRRLEALAGDPEVARRVASALGWSPEQLPVAELFWGLRELLEGIARDGPLIVVIDDVHWAAPTLLELIEHLVERGSEAPMLVICTARPDMVDAHPEWSEGPYAGRLLLDRLPDEACAIVISNTTGGAQVPAAIRDRILRAAEGNPLFVEQVVSMLIDSGDIVEADGEWRTTRSLDQLRVPPSIQALLSARLDMLDAPERSVLAPASVMGQAFASGAVRDLTLADVRDRVPDHLTSMVRKRLVQEEPEHDADGADYRFHHVLIRDAAYHGVLKRARADLHERFADWLERISVQRDRPGELDEVIGYHLEQAYGYRGQLGPIDAHARVLGSRAAEKLATAGRRAFVRGDLPAAVDLLGRGMTTLAAGDPTRLMLMPDLGEALMESGSFERAVEILAEADDAPDDPACRPTVARARLVRQLVDLYAGNEEGWAERTESEVARSIPIFEASGDDAGLATAWRLRSIAQGSALQYDAAAEAAHRIIRHAQAADDVRQQRRGAVAYSLSALHGPTPVREGIAHCEKLIATVEGDRRTQAAVQLCLAQLVAMDGQIDRARQAYADARRMLEELGQSVLSAATSTDSAPVEVMAGDLATAEEQLRRDDAELKELGETYVRATVTGMLAHVLVLRGDRVEAERAALESRELAGPDDVDAQMLWRSSLARCRAAEGRHQDALELAAEAVALTSGVAAPLMRAQALADRAAVLNAAGRVDEAAADLAAALALHEAKGNLVGAEGVRSLVAGSAAVG